ncbi:MAG TPA: methyltransferase domain-containing protein [Chloroflexia bacterium]|nr:methyltransferase domain-containing protein [Chloroflexia bacterium]
MQMTAAARWEQALAAWAIPPAILAAAPESPWTFPPALFAARADAARGQQTPSSEVARAALPAGGVVLDVGCGAGAASLPLAAQAGTLIGVDPSADLLAAFAERAAATGRTAQTVQGTWPASAGQTPRADVVVCHHVVYNVPDLPAFVQALTAHARGRVVLELTARHPLSDLNALWLQFHGLVRPGEPTADTVVAVLREMGMAPERRDWTTPASGPAGGFAQPADLVAWTRRRLCLPASRDPEIATALAAHLADPTGAWRLRPRAVVTLWWAGSGA